MAYTVQPLPPPSDLETKAVLKKLAEAHRHLAELKGMAATIPNEHILINTLALQEAKDSSAIENIVTTHDALYKTQLFADLISDAAAKEVVRYAEALKCGFDLVRRHRILSNAHILEIQRTLEQNDAGYRRLPGTALVNEATGETVYTPPQEHAHIVALMENLVAYINDAVPHDVDALIKMSVLHLQFESIHPFYDGNGRTGRILNILHLVLHGLLDLPILYLSRYIIRHKSDYYRLLQSVRDSGNWEPWLLYILEGVAQTAQQTMALIREIRRLMQDYKHRIRTEYPRLYSQDFINNLFRHPYTKIEFLMNDLQVSRLTATKYLDTLADDGFLEKQKIGRSNFYINRPLYDLFRAGRPAEEGVPPITTVNPIS